MIASLLTSKETSSLAAVNGSFTGAISLGFSESIGSFFVAAAAAASAS
jgi:hypothetical protein